VRNSFRPASPGHAPARFGHRAPPEARLKISLAAPQHCAQAFERAQMHPLAEGIANLQRRTIFSAKVWITEISSPRRKSLTSALSGSLAEQGFRPRGERMQTLQDEAGACERQRLDGRARACSASSGSRRIRFL